MTKKIKPLDHTIRVSSSGKVIKMKTSLKVDADKLTRIGLLSKSVTPETYEGKTSQTVYGFDEEKNLIIELFIEDKKVFDSETKREQKFLSAIFLTKEECEAYREAPFM